MLGERTAIAFLLCLVLATLAGAQLSGNYTVDPNGSGPNNFTTMAAAVGALGAGVAGPVNFDVKPATYTGLLVLTSVPGASSVNLIRFSVQGSTPAVLDANGSSVAVMGFDAAWFHFTNFRFTNATARALYLFGISAPGSNHNTFTNCEFLAPASTSSTVRAAFIEYSYNNTFAQCRFIGGGYTVYHSQSNSNTFDGCEFDGRGTASQLLYCINSNDSDNLVQNCFFHDCGASGYAIYANASQYGIMFWHNTIIVTTSSSCVWAGGCCAWTRANSWRNNIFVNRGTGTAMKYGTSSATLLIYNDLDYNCYYAPNTTKGTVETAVAMTAGSGFTAGTLAAWKAYFAANPSLVPAGGGTSWDQNSIEGDPGLNSLTTPYDIHLQGSSPLVDAGTTTYVAGAWISFPATASVATDFEGDARGALPDIGADEMAIRLSGSGSGVPGTAIAFALVAANDAGLPYQMGSALGNGPIPIGSRTLELSADSLLVASTSGTIPAVFQNYAGLLDGQGQATARLAIPNIPALKGIRIYTAFVTLKASAPFGISNISNAFLFTIQ